MVQIVPKFKCEGGCDHIFDTYVDAEKCETECRKMKPRYRNGDKIKSPRSDRIGVIYKEPRLVRVGSGSEISKIFSYLIKWDGEKIADTIMYEKDIIAIN